RERGLGRVRRGAPVCRRPRDRHAGDRARPRPRRRRGDRGALPPSRRRPDRPAPVHRGQPARAGRALGPSRPLAERPGSLLRNAGEPPPPGGGEHPIAARAMAHGRAHVAALGAADRARRARPGAALGVPGELRDRVRRARPQGLTVLAYYAVAAPQEFWTDHWGRYSVEELLAIARRSPLTGLITQALPDDGVILEAGCGLGQYVLLLRERGWRVAGWVRHRNREIARRGGAFYQSAFSRAELAAALARCGFSVRAAHPYDPARILRQALRPLIRRGRRDASAAAGDASPAGASR